MSEWTTYLSVVDDAGGWIDSANAIDNSTGTSSLIGGSIDRTLSLSHPVAASESGIITKVEMRMYGYENATTPYIKMYFIPTFISGVGTSREVNWYSPAWGSWYDVTADPNAPGTWTWAEVEGIGANILHDYVFGTPVGVSYCASVEIRVTYEEVSTVAKPYPGRLLL